MIYRFYQKYQSIDVTNPTKEQMDYLKEFNKRQSRYYLTGSDMRFISMFSWINTGRLTDRDKIFLMQTANDFGHSLMSAM
jgi:hypothetical protein